MMRAIRAFDVVARLKPGVTIEAAQAELTMIADRLAREYPDTNKGAGTFVEPIRDGIVGSNLQTTSLFLLGVVGVVLLLCCANVANLLLARTTARGTGIAVRSAMGAAAAASCGSCSLRAWCSRRPVGRLASSSAP